ncbi:MAG: Thymidylate kinase (EC 2.7.4.9) [Olavius algarvensis Delta 4 endosymbiont]|nr:MAG: Thymidylate kinase (EC 2.7.4.9) [Olavius algarvensis Delta 4 endosymbiont]
MFITLEGIEGSGKTSQVKKMAAFLEDGGHPYLLTREPGGTRIGRRIRQVLLDPDSNDLDPVAELLLYNADRVQHVHEVIRPALAAGKIVICDRYVDATRAYQGVARRLDVDLVETLHRLLVDNLKPDLTFLLDLPPEEGLRRAREQIDSGARSDRETRFEKEALAFHTRVREGYLRLAAGEPERFVILDAAASLEEVWQQLSTTLEKTFNQDGS